MSPAEIALVVLSALLHAIWSASIKGSANPLGFNLLQLLPPIAAACVLPFWVPLAAIPSGIWVLVAGTGICHGFYFYWMARALETGELSVVYPIARSAPAFLPLVAIPLLGESITLRGGLGLAAVVAGMLAIQVDGIRGVGKRRPPEAEAPASGVASQRRAAPSQGWRSKMQLPAPPEATQPASRVASQRRAATPQGRRAAPSQGSLAPGTAFAFATLVASVGYSLFDKAAMSELGAAPWSTPVPQAIVYYVLLSISGGLVFTPLALRRVPPRDLRALARTELRPALVAALVSFASYGLILQALRTAPVSYVVATRQTSVLFAIAIGVVRWHERPSRLRLVGALATVIGVVLVAESRG